MKKFCLLLCLLVACLSVGAQSYPFTYKEGGVLGVGCCEMDNFVELPYKMVKMHLALDKSCLYVTLFDFLGRAEEMAYMKRTLEAAGSFRMVRADVTLRLSDGKILKFSDVNVADDLPEEMRELESAVRFCVYLEFDNLAKCDGVDVSQRSSTSKREMMESFLQQADLDALVAGNFSIRLSGRPTKPTLQAMFARINKVKSAPSTPDPQPEEPESLADITSIKTVHNVVRQGVKGMNVVFSAKIRKMRNRYLGAGAYFYFENGQPLRDMNGNFYDIDTGDVFAYTQLRPDYDNAVYTNVPIFIPYNELHLSHGRHNLKVYVAIYDLDSGRELGNSEFAHFWMQW